MFCTNCGYDLTSISGEVNFCPKCGTRAVSDGSTTGDGRTPAVTLQPKGRAALYQPQSQPQGVQVQSMVGGQQVVAVWMSRPEQIPGVPPGLEYLSQLDQLLIKQQIELLEITTKMHTPNKYNVNNSVGQQVYFIGEESDDCTRMYCPHNRSFVLHCMDNYNQEVMRMSREYVCCVCTMCACLDSCRTEFNVEAPVGNTIGYVTQRTSFCPTMGPRYTIMDARRQDIASVEGPGCICEGQCCTSDQEFEILHSEGSRQIGMITKQWTNYAQEMFTKANNFSVTFSANANVIMKALFLAATFVVDYTIFE